MTLPTAEEARRLREAGTKGTHPNLRAEYQLALLLVSHGNSRGMVSKWLGVSRSAVGKWCAGSPCSLGLSPAERLELYSMPEPNTGCWLWFHSTSPNGYGRIGVSGRSAGAHRVAYELAHGPIPEGMFVCHKCDTPACVNPDHLFLGTPLDNMRDKCAKGRGIRGVKSWRSRLTPDAVLDIRARRGRGESMADIGREYGVTRQAIYRVVAGKNWRHIQ